MSNCEDDAVLCPYDPQHVVPYARMPYHLMKCKKNYRGPELDTCPFNATHLVKKGTLDEHYKTCIAYYHASRPYNEKKLML